MEELMRMMQAGNHGHAQYEPSLKDLAVSAMFGVDVVKKSGESNGSSPDDSNGSFTYTYSMVPRKESRSWEVLSKVWAHELPDVPAIKEGYLNVRTGLLGANWARAWFVWRRPFLFQYATKYDSYPLKVLFVTDCKIARGRDELDIILKGPIKSWCMQAANDEDLQGWMYALDPIKYDNNMASVISDF